MYTHAPRSPLMQTEIDTPKGGDAGTSIRIFGGSDVRPKVRHFGTLTQVGTLDQIDVERRQRVREIA